MRKCILLFILLPFLGLCQVQIGSTIYGFSENDRLGESVSISGDGNTFAVGEFNSDINSDRTGRVLVYQKQSGDWVQLGNDIDGGESSRIGGSISLSSNGNRIAIYDFSTDGIAGFNVGSTKVFEFQANIWVQIGQTIEGEGQQDSTTSNSNLSISSDGSILAIGTPQNDGGGVNSGHVRVFNYDSSTSQWLQIGDDIDGEDQNNGFGVSVDLSSNGQRIVIGAPVHFNAFSTPGHVRVFEYQGGSWVQIGDEIEGEGNFDLFGRDVNISSNGNIIAVGARDNDGNGQSSGHVRIYEYQVNDWIQLGNDIDGEGALNGSGENLSLSSDGTVVAVGSIFNDVNGFRTGHVRVFKYSSTDWTQVGIDIDGEAEGDDFSSDLSLSADGSIVVVGARFNDVNGSDSGQVKVFDLSSILSVEDVIIENYKLYPNPTKTQFTIQVNPSVELEEVSIHNLLGQVVLTSKEHIVNTSKLASGSYIVEVITNQGKATKKLIID
ncbi:MAG: T9SS type A sorting domain-containing protein [Psychroserpens sp.]|uniref:T9SS type A sorting domain-containing protein n=1 Tax=Psychroserpens sp. TaxID=2020870 RepID=UPI0030022679